MTSIVDVLDTQDKIVVAGAGGFIGGHLVKRFMDLGFRNVVAVDKKPLREWYQRSHRAMNICADLSREGEAEAAMTGAVEVYNLAADMGGMGFISNFRVECMRSVLINTHMLEAAYRQGVQRYFYASSACVYNKALQAKPNVTALRESDAYPADAERGYGWEKLYGEMMCHEYCEERGLETHVARFHNVYGPWGTWDGGREKAPAALIRKVIAWQEDGVPMTIWGNGEQTRSFMYIADCITGIDQIMHSETLVDTPVNLGTSELVTIRQLLKVITDYAGVTVPVSYDLAAPQGVAGRNSDNTLIRKHLDWEPKMPLGRGIPPTYDWIYKQYMSRKAGKKVNFL